MNLTPEELAQRFDETYARVAPQMKGCTHKEVLTAVCAEILGVPVADQWAEKVTQEGFAEAGEHHKFESLGEPIAKEWKEPLPAEEYTGDWQKDWDREIEEASARLHRPQKLFSGRVGD